MDKSKANDISNTSDDDIRNSSVIKTRSDIRRKVHNGIEKRRKDKINYWIHKIADLLPFKDPKRESKNNLLENVFHYILTLKEKNESLMFGNNVNSIHAEETRRLMKQMKELEEKNLNYYRLLRLAGISPNSSPQDIAFERPTKYSKKITEEQVRNLFKKSFDNNSSDSETFSNNNNKRNNDSEKNNEQNCNNSCNKKSKSKSKNKKRKELNKNERKSSPPTPVLPNNSNNTINNNTNCSTSGQTCNSGSIVLLNDQNMSTVSDETPRLIVNSGNGLNSLNTIQIRPTIGGQQLQLISANPNLDLHSNSNLLSGQLLFNLNPTPPQPQASAVLLPNGQILPIITQPQQQQQPLIYAPNHGFLLATSSAQTQFTNSFISSQTASIGTNITANSIHLTSSSNQKIVNNQKSQVKTTTIETIPLSPKPIKRKPNKKLKKTLTTKTPKINRKNNKNGINSDNDDKKSNNSDILTEVSVKVCKNVEKNTNKENDKSNKSIKSDESCELKVTKTKATSESVVNNCDILAKATESIFSPPPNSEKSNKKESLSVNELIEKQNNNNDKTSDKSKKRQDSQLKSSASDENEVISKYCANIANKANIELINDTNKNDNYVTSDGNNSKIERNIAAGNKAEMNKKSNNATDSTHKLSNDGRVAETTFHSNNNTTSCQSSSTTSTLTFGFCNTQNDTNNNQNQTIVTENELPSLLLSGLTDENDVSAESVHSVSNSSLPAFLSLSPEHLTDYLPKENITNTTQTTSTTLTREQISNNSIPFRLNSGEQNVDPHAIRHESPRIQHQKDQSFPQYSKPNEIAVALTPQTETRSYSSNFPTISTLISNEFSEFPANKSVIPNNNYLENLNPNININKVNHQNNFSQFPLQNDNSIMPLYPMHSYPNHLNNNNNTNRDLNSNINRTFFNSNENQSNLLNSTASKAPQIPSQTRAQQQPTQQSKPSQAVIQPNNVIPIRTHRNSSTELQLQPQHSVRQEQRHPSQPSQNSRETIASTTTSTNTLNKTTNSVSSVQYSNQNSFSVYSAEALIRQNEPSLQQIQTNDQNRYNSNNNTNNTGNSNPSRIPQQNQSQTPNMNFSDTSGIRSSSRATISYSAESLIQSNSLNNTNQATNKSSRTEPLNTVNNMIESNRISYYQHINNSNNNINNIGNSNNNSVQRNDQNANTLFNFDHTLNSRIPTSTSSATSHNFNNSVSLGYPQITFNSHLPEIPTSTTTTSSNSSLFPIASNSTTVSTNSSRSPANSINSNTNTGNNNSSGNIQTIPNSVASQQQHSPVVYPTHSQNSNTQQNKRSTNNSFNPSVNPFSHSSVESYANPSNTSSMYSSGSLIDTNLSSSTNHYQRNARNNDIRFTNCLQTSDENANSSTTQHNNPNSGCFFSNTGPVSVHSNTTSFFPPSSATPFPPLLPSAASPFDATTFGGSHRPPMFANTFMTDLNASFVNNSGNNSLTPITSTNFNINSSTTVHNNNNTNNNSNKPRDQQQTHARSSSTNISRSPNPSKHTKISTTSNGSNSKSSSKKVSNTNKQQNPVSDTSNNTSSNSTLRHLNDSNYFSVSDFVSSSATTPQTNNRYSNFFPNPQTHTPSRHPVPPPVSQPSSHSSTNKNSTSSADTSSSYTLFRPQSQNNGININFQSSSGSFSVNSLHNSNRTASTTTPSNFASSSSHHSHHVPNFNLSNIFPDINSNANESLPLSPIKFVPSNPILAPPPPPPPPPPPVVPPPVASSVSHTPSMDVSTSYPNHSGSHHQNIYHSHHHSSRISTPHNTMPFNSFLSSGTTPTQHTNVHNFDHHMTGNNRTPSTAQMTGIANGSHPSPSFTATHHSHHTYANIVPSFNFSMHEH